MIVQPTSTKGTGSRSCGCARKAIELTSGDLLRHGIVTEGEASHDYLAAELSRGRRPQAHGEAETVRASSRMPNSWVALRQPNSLGRALQVQNTGGLS